jgi:hypothetical protein
VKVQCNTQSVAESSTPEPGGETTPPQQANGSPAQQQQQQHRKKPGKRARELAKQMQQLQIDEQPAASQATVQQQQLQQQLEEILQRLSDALELFHDVAAWAAVTLHGAYGGRGGSNTIGISIELEGALTNRELREELLDMQKARFLLADPQLGPNARKRLLRRVAECEERLATLRRLVKSTVNSDFLDASGECGSAPRAAGFQACASSFAVLAEEWKTEKQQQQLPQAAVSGPIPVFARGDRSMPMCVAGALANECFQPNSSLAPVAQQETQQQQTPRQHIEDDDALYYDEFDYEQELFGDGGDDDDDGDGAWE